MENKDKNTKVVYNDGIVQIVLKEEQISIISPLEDEMLQLKHDQEMAERFGFKSVGLLRRYLEICHSNPDWASSYGFAGFLSNKSDIEEFNADDEAFATKVIDYVKPLNGYYNYFGPPMDMNLDK
jgi:hypothetical protein